MSAASPRRSAAPLCAAMMITSCALAACSGPRADEAETVADANADTICACELRSWLVAGRARHLLLEIDCPEPVEDLSGVIEFGAAFLRSDYRPPRDPQRANRLAMMLPGERVVPIFGSGRERIEVRWEISSEQARLLRRDRMFESQYILLRTNSNAALRAALEEAGLDLPGHLLEAGGLLSEFPGLHLDPGSEVPAQQWNMFGLPGGPAPSP